MDPSTVDDVSVRSGANLDTAATSHVGYVRGRNEDSYLHDADRGLFVVADGLGGHPAGDVASRVAVETLDARLDAAGLAEDAAGHLEQAILSAHEEINAEVRRNPSTEGMGTTIVASWTDGEELVIASVGDSRAYLMRDGELSQVTTDDVWNGVFGRSLSQALGGSSDVTVEVVHLELQPGDRVLLCTDGLTDMVDDELIAELLGAQASASDIVERLTASALDHGGYDNITLIALLTD